MQAIFDFFDQMTAFFQTESQFLQISYKMVFVLVGTSLLWLIIRWILTAVEKRLAKYEFIQINVKLFTIIRKAIFYGLILVAGTYLIRLIEVPLVEKIFQALLIVVIAFPAKDFLKIAIGYLQRNMAQKTENTVDDIVFDLLSKFAGAIVFITAIIIALDMLGVNIMPFVAGAGVAGVAIGFAAKDTLSNLIAGILLIVDRPFEVGDRIEVWNTPSGTSTWGDVIDIGLRATKIRTTDNIIVVIPNNEIMTRDIINYTLISEKIRVRIDIGVAYDADIKKAKDIIIKVAKSAEWIAHDPPPKVVVRNFGESAVKLQLRVWINEARNRMNTISYITDKVKEAFDREGMKIPYPRREIYMTQKNE